MAQKEVASLDTGIEKSTSLILEKLESWYELILKGLPNFVVAIVVITAFWFVAKVARKAIRNVLTKSNISESIQGLFLNIFYIGIIVLGLFVALGILHLDKTVTSLLAGAGVIGLALGFAFQEIASNFVSGVMIALRQPYNIGHIVKIEGMMGTVETIGLRTTTVRSFDGIEMLIPNKAMFTRPLYNYSTTPKRRLDISLGVSYGDDLEKIEGLVKNALEGIEGRVDGKPIEVFFKEFGSSSINFDIRIWVDYPANMNFLKYQHQAIINIKKIFDANDISIPFPIRTLDFGVKGGVPLEDPLTSIRDAKQSQSQASAI